jgi:UDP-N-acetylmuramoyl-tripeptide--D-alanyl-D-alanine ligase
VKQLLKKIVLAVLSGQVRRLQQRWQPKVVAVTGSIGKTSTKFAASKVLGQKYRVRFQEGNYNDIITVPLVFFGEKLPSLFNPFAWTVVFLKNEFKLRRSAPYDVIVLELGTDGPGQIAAFKRYLHVDLAVVTAIAYEHMEFFTDLDAVAREELAVQKYSDRLIVNADLCASKYLKNLSVPAETYAINKEATYGAREVKFTGEAFDFVLQKDGKKLLAAKLNGVARNQVYSALAGAVVADRLGVSPNEIINGIAQIEAVPGRMQLFKGVNGSTILDDTYNASPEAVKAALDTLYGLKAPQKIALLGNMNELGDYSEGAHKEVGNYCDPEQIDLLVTLGKHANEFLAPAGRARGCHVQACTSPYQAGEYLKAHIKPGAAVLIKGSQNGVFAEEAVKLILADHKDEIRLVRQSRHWAKLKKRQFGR